MDIEFHYYMTYLVAARAGYTPAEATTIAHAAQSVDDNHIPVRIVDSDGLAYENAISQTMDIMRPHEDSLIYPIFHFIPGDPKSPTARRVDKVEHPMVTTPDSALANAMIDAAIRSGDLYRIGVSAHGYVDTWAHQNFVGKRDKFNEFAQTAWERVEQWIMAVGHAHAKHNPDWPALVWEDARLVDSRVDNRARFLDAAAALYVKLARAKRPNLTEAQLAREAVALRTDLDADIGARDDENAARDQRIARYIARGAKAEYGGAPIAPYVLGTWFDEAIVQRRSDVLSGMKTKLVGVVADIADFFGDYMADAHRQDVKWKEPSPKVYRLTNWFRFQEAVKAHLAECGGLLRSHGHATLTR